MPAGGAVHPCRAFSRPPPVPPNHHSRVPPPPLSGRGEASPLPQYPACLPRSDHESTRVVHAFSIRDTLRRDKPNSSANAAIRTSPSRRCGLASSRSASSDLFALGPEEAAEGLGRLEGRLYTT